MHPLTAKRVVPVATLEWVDDAKPLAEALLAGGANAIELTLRTPAALEAIARMAEAYPELYVGAGTVLTGEQVDQAVEAGASFAVAPGLNEQVVRHARKRGLFFAPGVMTPTDIDRAMGLGCRLLKFFPAEPSGGIAMLKALAGPYLHKGPSFLPLGGIRPDNMLDYLRLPMVAAIGGSWMTDSDLIARKDWPAITARVADAVARASAIPS